MRTRELFCSARCPIPSARRPAAFLIGSIWAVTTAAGCTDGTGETASAPAEKVRQAVVQAFTLPIPIGLNPESLVVAATDYVALNDRSQLLETDGQVGNTASVGALQNNIGVGVRVRNAWTNGPLLVRGAFVSGYVKTGGQLTIQQGSTFGDPQENRDFAPIRRDPWFTGSIGTSEQTTFTSIEPGQTITISPGVTGHWVVKTNATLTLARAGIYNLRSLDLEPGSHLVLPAAGVVQIYVADSLILRSVVPGPNTILAYLGTAPVQIEAAFLGQLFLAPNAAVEVKASSFGRLFAKVVIVHQDRIIIARTMTAEARAIYMPVETTRALGIMGGNGGGDELGSSVLTPGEAPQCGLANPLAFVSHHSRSVMKGGIGPAGFVNPAEMTPLGFPADPPFGCASTPYPNLLPPHLAGLFPPGVPTPKPGAYYGPSLTDNLVARLPGGRLIQIGFTTRFCADPPGVGTNCPAAAAPGTACATAVNPNACSYGGAVPHNPAVDLNCLCADPEGDPPTAPSYFAVWNCQTRRTEGGALAVRASADCGASWNAGALDLYEAGTTLPPPANPDRLRANDRPELYVDPFDDRMYLSATWVPGGAPMPGAHVMVEGRPKSFTKAADISWTVIRNENFDAAPRVMTTVRDDRALLTIGPPAAYGQWVHLAVARCAGARPLLAVHTPFGWREWDLAGTSTDQSLLCGTVSKGTNGMPFSGIHYGPSIVGVSSAPPRLLVAYSGLLNGFEITNVLSVTLRSADGYAQRPEVVRIARVFNGDPPNGHVIFPQLIQVDGLGGSDVVMDTPVLLRVATVNGDTIRELGVVFYSGVTGAIQQLSSWSLSAAYPGNNCATTTTFGCFIGDYRYGSLVDKQGSLRFFTPWIGGNPNAAAGASVQASLFQIAP